MTPDAIATLAWRTLTMTPSPPFCDRHHASVERVNEHFRQNPDVLALFGCRLMLAHKTASLSVFITDSELNRLAGHMSVGDL